MGLQSLCGRDLVGFSVFLLLFAVSFCCANDKTIQVVGIGECADCKESNIKTIHAFSGLRVTINCKAENGGFKTRGEGELDKDGKFEVSLPNEMVKDGKLKEDCYAQLHSASAAPCPAHNGIEASKIVLNKSENNNEKHTLKPAGNLKFSTALCTSAFLWPHYKYPPLPKFSPFPIYKKPFPPLNIPPIKSLPPPFPIYKKPLPPLNIPPIKSLPPPFPIYKPIPPFYKKPFPPLIPTVLIHPKLPPNFLHHPLFQPSIPHP